MSRFAIVICLLFCMGCNPGNDPVSLNPAKGAALEDGGFVDNPDRNRAEAYLAALDEVQSVEEERKLLIEFGDWLNANGYAIAVVEKNGAYELSCPHFPPVTPWIIHSFLDVTYLELLPSQGKKVVGASYCQ